jgi:hypothetical protein
MRTGTAPEMSLERALDDHLLMETVYASVDRPVPAAAAR